MPRILYISCHSILEYDELTLFTELGYDCFSLGAYTDPAGHYQLPRPAIQGMKTHPELIEMSRNMPRTELTWEFVDKFDIIIVMDGYSGIEVIAQNWHLFKDKKVIWRTIGQSIPSTEKKMKRFRNEGIKIVRYSPMEEKLEGYIGGDALIRFYKDPEEFTNWNGNTDQVINFSQSLKGRRDFCGYDTLMAVGPGNPFKVYGNGNEDLGEFNGGELSYDSMKGAMRDCSVYLYGGTWPASYTLSFIEAMMTGIPMVCAGTDLWRHKDNRDVNIYEVPRIIERGTEGFWSDYPEELKGYIKTLREDKDLARRIGEAGRQKAIKLFGKETIKEQWKSFLLTL
jgi:glycosyltransferase involved in cell wall biosynthesis